MCNSCTSCLGLAEQTARQMSSREDLLWWDAPHVGGSPVWLCLGQHGRMDVKRVPESDKRVVLCSLCWGLAR